MTGKTFEASYFDAWYKRLLSANPTEHEKHVTSYLAFAEGRLLLPYLDELRNAADEIGMRWELAETLLRETLHKYDDGHEARQSPQKAQHRSLNPPPILGERDENVARRRTALRNMMRSRQCAGRAFNYQGRRQKSAAIAGKQLEFVAGLIVIPKEKMAHMSTMKCPWCGNIATKNKPEDADGID